MEHDKGKTLKFRVPTTFAKRLEETVALRRMSASKPIINRSQAILEALSEWMDRQAA
jgi:hypothetical protein